MSSDIYAEPDLSKKVRYNRKVEEEKVEWKEEKVDTYENPDAICDHQTDFQSQEGEPLTKQDPAVQTKSFRAAALCLGVLCLLMTVGIIILSICYISVTVQKDQLQTTYNKMSINYSQVQGKLIGKLCPEGWIKFGCSCYFKSTGKESWYDSRTDCQSRGSDLVITNSKEEQEFLTKLHMNGESWIGLRTVEQKGTHKGWEWEWVDGSPLTQTFWLTEELEDPTTYFYAACCDQQGKWIQMKNQYKNWICEK